MFEQPFHLSYLNILTGLSPLPASWTIHVSENESSFTPLVSFYSDDPAECLGMGSGDMGMLGREMMDLLMVIGEETDRVQCEVAPDGYEVCMSLIEGRKDQRRLSDIEVLQTSANG